MGEKINGKYEIFGDDPEELAKINDPDKDGRPGLMPGFWAKRRVGKWLATLPQNVRQIPNEEEKKDIIETITNYGIWFMLNYGGQMIGLICKPCSMVFSQVVKFRTGITQKDLPFIKG